MPQFNIFPQNVIMNNFLMKTKVYFQEKTILNYLYNILKNSEANYPFLYEIKTANLLGYFLEYEKLILVI